MSLRRAKTNGAMLCQTLIVLAVLVAAPVVVCAEQLNFPLAAFSDEELAKVRDWEKTIRKRNGQVFYIIQIIPVILIEAHNQAEPFFLIKNHTCLAACKSGAEHPVNLRNR